jgi:hypothetical protein
VDRVAFTLKRISLALTLGTALMVCACSGGGDPGEADLDAARSGGSASDLQPGSEGDENSAIGAWAFTGAAGEGGQERSGSLDFPHSAHADVACSRCHSGLPGHDTHRGVDCAQCHGPRPTENLLPSRAAMGETSCLTCHHDPAIGVACSRCHAPEDAGPLAVTQRFGIAGRVAERTTTFDHGVHGDQQCATCHADPVSRIRERDCQSCHQDHHQPNRDCAQCHVSSLLASHDPAAHLGCTGSTCHDTGSIAALSRLGSIGPTAGRTTCLICHQTQTAHAPARACDGCHFPGGNPIGAHLAPEAGGQP